MHGSIAEIGVRHWFGVRQGLWGGVPAHLRSGKRMETLPYLTPKSLITGHKKCVINSKIPRGSKLCEVVVPPSPLQLSGAKPGPRPAIYDL